MGSAALLAMGTGTALKTVASLQQADRARADAELTAQASDRAASDAVRRGELRDLQVAMRGSAVTAAQQVAQSGTGILTGVGASRTALEASSAVNEVDRRTVRINAALDAYGLRERSRAARQEGANAHASGVNAAVGTFLSGVASVSEKLGERAADQPGEDE